jgi:segregation and condensation protein B
MNARKMNKQKKPGKAEASKSSAKRSAAAESFEGEDEPGTSKRPKPGASRATPSKTAAKGKGDARGKDSAASASKAKPAPAKGRAAGPTNAKGAASKAATTSPGKTKAAPGKAATTSAGNARAAGKAATTSAGKAKAAPGKGATTSAGNAKAAGKAMPAAGKGKAANRADDANAVKSKTARGAAAKRRQAGDGDRPDLELVVEEVFSDEVDDSERASDEADVGEADREAGAGTITEDDDWLDEAEDRADSAARERDGDERGEPLMSDISEIRGPRGEDAELAEGEVDLGEEISADSQPAPTTRAHLKRVIESLIFVSEQAVTANQLARLVKSKAAEVREVVTEIMRDYDGRGIELVEVGGGFQFRSAAASAPFVRDLVSARPVRLTRAQLETLALIAYRQPITRPEIDDVRGVDSGSAIKVLLDRDLVKILGRKDEAGRPLLYGTAPAFLEFFGMNSLSDLPTLREFTELSEENRELFAKKMGEVPDDLSDPAFEPAVKHQEYDEEGNPIAPVTGPVEGDALAADAEATDVEREEALDREDRGEVEPSEQDEATADSELRDRDKEDDADDEEEGSEEEDEDSDDREAEDRADHDAEDADESDERDEDEDDADSDDDSDEDSDDEDSDEDEIADDDEAIAQAEESDEDDEDSDEDEIADDDEAIAQAEESDEDDEDSDEDEIADDDEAIAQAEELDDDESEDDDEDTDDEDEADDEDDESDADEDEDEAKSQ